MVLGGGGCLVSVLQPDGAEKFIRGRCYGGQRSRRNSPVHVAVAWTGIFFLGVCSGST